MRSFVHLSNTGTDERRVRTLHAGVECDDVTICSECHRVLQRGDIPPASLVRLDTGPWPEDDDGPLPVPTFIEATIIAPYRPLRSIVTCRGGEAASTRGSRAQ